MTQKKRKRGRPPYHLPVLNVEKNQTYDTFEAAAKDVDGYRQKVYNCCHGVQSQHKGHHFKFVKKKRSEEE